MFGKLSSIALALFTLSCSDTDGGGRSKQMAHDAGTERAHADDDFAYTISASGTHTCAIRHAGLYCWGENFRGQLGDGTTEDSTNPILVSGAGDDVVEVIANTARTCTRHSTGAVSCWGANESGQNGDGTRVDSSSPIPVVGIDDAVQVAIDTLSTCVVRGAKGSVECWGQSPEDSTDSGSLLPQPIEGLSQVLELRAGSFSTYCARGKAGWVRCFRFDPETKTWTAPTNLEALTGARAITVPAQDEACAISEAREIVCQNIEDGFTVKMPDSEGTVTINSQGTLGMIGRKSDGTWWLWNVPSIVLTQMGVPGVIGTEAFQLISEPPMVEAVIAGFTVCAVQEDHNVVCVDAERQGFAGQTLIVASAVSDLPD
jgi:hypothetical protein